MVKGEKSKKRKVKEAQKAKQEELRHLLNSVNEAARTARQGWIFFLSVMVYLAVATLSISDKDILLFTPVTLPILRIDISLVSFFRLAPVLMLILHFGTLFQHSLLEKKLLSLDSKLGGGGVEEKPYTKR